MGFMRMAYQIHAWHNILNAMSIAQSLSLRGNTCRSGGSALLEVRASNAAAIAMYQRHLGFATVGRRRGYYADGEDALLMALPMPSTAEDF